jgi:hypothetical protein
MATLLTIGSLAKGHRNGRAANTEQGRNASGKYAEGRHDRARGRRVIAERVILGEAFLEQSAQDHENQKRDEEIPQVSARKPAAGRGGQERADGVEGRQLSDLRPQYVALPVMGKGRVGRGDDHDGKGRADGQMHEDARTYAEMGKAEIKQGNQDQAAAQAEQAGQQAGQKARDQEQ